MQEKLIRIGHVFEQTLEGCRFLPPLLKEKGDCQYLSKHCSEFVSGFIKAWSVAPGLIDSSESAYKSAMPETAVAQ